MNLHDESALAEVRHAVLRHLPQQVAKVGRRLHRFLQDGWDVNGLVVIRDDALRLVTLCRAQDLPEPAEQWQAMAEMISDTLQQERLPDPTVGERLWNLIENLGTVTPAAPEVPAEKSGRRVASGGAVSTRAETPPPGFWRRWGDDAPPPSLEAEPAAAAVVGEDPDPWGTEATRYGKITGAPSQASERENLRRVAEPTRQAPAPTTPAATPGLTTSQGTPDFAAIAAAAPAPVVDAQAAPAWASPTDAPTAAKVAIPMAPLLVRVYHLSALTPMSIELDQRMEAQGFEVELVEDAPEMAELLGALPADLALVDSAFMGEIEVIGEAVKKLRARQQKCKLVGLADADDVALRLSAQRAGVDALLVGSGNATAVLERLRTLMDPNSEEPYRVLIVEDDRSQALFAEGVLRNAGMQSMVVLEALGVMPALEQFQPDLILMDLHMPDANGIELTALIREREEFLHTPIVFLSGESDQDRQFDALDAGGDDFLAKPIRPRHLIASVQNRVRRKRAMASRQKARPERDPETGLHSRADLMHRLEQAVKDSVDTSAGGVLFVEIEGMSILRDRLGLGPLELILTQAARVLTSQTGNAAVARFGDSSYLVLDHERDEVSLEALAMLLRNSLMAHGFEAEGRPLRLRATAGVCAFRHHFANATEMLSELEKVSREARSSERGLRRYEPAKPSEAARAQKLLEQVRDAVKNQRLELLYQPVVAVAGSDDSQYQVLLRLKDAEGKLLPAAQVVPLAEKGDFILDIDRWVLQQALALIRDRAAEGRSLRLFVTQSPLTMGDAGQAQWLISELAAHGVPGTSLVMELRLEDAALHTDAVSAFCQTLMPEGVQFCLSQFESGQVGQSLLERLPLGFVKLARKYTASGSSAALRDDLKLLIDRAHRHGLEVIGHGVEDAQSAATLWMSGIDFIQGNLVQQADRGLDFDFQQAVL